MTLMEGKPLSPGFASGIAVVYDFEVERKLALRCRSPNEVSKLLQQFSEKSSSTCFSPEVSRKLSGERQ